MSACRPSAVTACSSLRDEAGKPSSPSGFRPTGAAQISALGDFFDNLAIETPAMRAVHRMAQQIREQQP